jgi:hypothetical protein
MATAANAFSAVNGGDVAIQPLASFATSPGILGESDDLDDEPQDMPSNDELELAKPFFVDDSSGDEASDQEGINAEDIRDNKLTAEAVNPKSLAAERARKRSGAIPVPLALGGVASEASVSASNSRLPPHLRLPLDRDLGLSSPGLSSLSLSSSAFTEATTVVQARNLRAAATAAQFEQRNFVAWDAQGGSVAYNRAFNRRSEDHAGAGPPEHGGQNMNIGRRNFGKRSESMMQRQPGPRPAYWEKRVDSPFAMDKSDEE